MGRSKKKAGNKPILKKAIGILIMVLVILACAVGVGSLWKEHHRKTLIAARGPVKIVVFGDSIWDICRDETGIAAVLEKELVHAQIINCTIMGTSAAYREQREGEEAQVTQEWNQKSLAGFLEADEPKQLFARQAGVEKIPLEEADYIIIAYGLNDYFSAVPIKTRDPWDLYSYCGALRSAIAEFQEEYPRAEILVLSQTYCQGYAYGKVDSESDYKDYGGGTGPDYVQAAQAVARERGCIFVNNYQDMGINIHNGTKYLSDATHLTERGRKKYAENLAEYLLEDYEEKLDR